MAKRFLRLRGLIISKFGTQEKFAQAMGLSNQALSNKLSGRNKITWDDMVKINELLDIDPLDIGKFYFLD